MQNLRLLNNETGVYLGNGISGSTILNCLILGSGPSANGAGIFAGFAPCNLVVRNNQIANYDQGCASNDSIAAGTLCIGNYISNCTYGLIMGPFDKYQGNVTTGCTTPFTGGVAVGLENN